MSTVDIVIFTEFTNSLIYSRMIGGYRIATELRKHGYSVQTIDFLNDWTLEELKTAIDKFVGSNTLFVGFSSTLFAVKDEPIGSTNRPYNLRRDLRYTEDFPFDPQTSKDLISYIKSKNSNTKIVLGGGKSQYMSSKLVDTYIHGFADYTTVQYANLLAGKPADVELVKINDRQNQVAWRQESPFDFRQCQTLWQDSDVILPGEVLPIEISRGCIFKCDYCSFPMNGKKKFDYIRDPIPLREEFIRNYEKFGTTKYVFCDDTFNDSIYKVESLYNEVFAKLPFKIEFVTYLRHDLIWDNREMADLLKESGLRTGVFGIETLNHQSAKAVGKGMHPDKIIELLHWLREDKWKDEVLTNSGFVIGLPHETEDTVNYWMEKVMDESFPLHGFNVEPLGLNLSDKKLWKSAFETNAAAHGYKTDSLKFNNSFFRWSNWNSGSMNLTTAWSIADRYATKAVFSGRNKISGFPFMIWQMGTGWDTNSLRGKPMKDVGGDFLIEAKTKLTTEYKNRMLK
jgi:Radical SAM superfamily